MRGRAMRLTKLTLLAMLCAALVAGAGCGGGQGVEPTPTPTISPSPVHSGIFEIYLVNTSNLSQVNYSNLETIPLQEIPLLTETHIISYNWSNHSIKLTDDGCKRFEEAILPEEYTSQSLTVVTYNRRAFVIVAYSKRVYSGEIWSSHMIRYSSYFPPYPVIVYATEDWGEDFKCNYSNTIEIACFSPFECAELLNSVIIYDALQQAGILIE